MAGSAAALPVPPGAFDCVVLGELLEHCADPSAIVAEAAQALRPGGYLLVTTPNGAYHGSELPAYRPEAADDEALRARQFGPEGSDHLFAFTAESLQAVAAGGRPAGPGA